MKTLRGFFLLLVSSLAFGQTAADKITAGRAALAAHDLATAQIRFQEALAINPTAEAAGALLGVTRCFTIVNWTSSYNFLNRLGMSSTGRNVYHWKATLSRDANGRVILPDNLNFTEASDFWLTTLIPESERARASLALVTNAGFLINFTTTETGLPMTTNIDFGDVLMMRASLRAAEFVGHAFSGQDLHLNIGSAWQLQQGDLLTLQRVLTDNPDFLKPGAFAERTAARTALLETIALYRQASEFIRARPAGLKRLFMIAPEELAKEADFRKWLDKAERSLNSFVNVAKDGSPDQWGYLGALATADFSFRGLLPPIASDGTFDPEAIPDPSLGGATVGISRAQIVNRLIDADLKPDLGVEWMNPKPQGNALNGYAYGAGTHVAVGAGGTLRTSTNGIDWTVKKLPTDANLQAVAYGAGRFVAVGYYTMWQSTDGQTWHEVKNAGGAFTAILYAGGRFVAMGGGAAVTSVDGLVWQFGYHGFAETYRAIVYSGTQYVAAGSGGALAGRILTSPDGLTWTSRLVTTTGRLRGIASNGSRLVALGENNVLASSTDGVNWTVGTMMTVTGTPPDYFAVASKDGRFVATGGQSAAGGQQSVVATSADGLTWTTVASGEQGNLYKAFAGPDAVYGFAWSGALVRATDGSTFVRVGGFQNAAPLPTTFLELRDLGGKLYALGTGGVMMTSTDGLAFAAVSTGVTADLWSVVRQGNVWLAVGNGGTVLKSADGVAWTPLAIGTSANLRTVAYLNGLYLVAGSAGTLFTSADGTAWRRDRRGSRPRARRFTDWRMVMAPTWRWAARRRTVAWC